MITTKNGKSDRRTTRSSGSTPELIDFLQVPRVQRELLHLVSELMNHHEDHTTRLGILQETLVEKDAQIIQIKEQVLGMSESLHHIAAANEKLNEAFFRKHVSGQLCKSLLALLELVERMQLAEADTGILVSEIHNVLAQFSMSTFEPEAGSDTFDPKTMKCQIGKAINDPIVEKTIRPGVIFRSQDGDEIVLSPAVVSLVPAAEKESATEKTALRKASRTVLSETESWSQLGAIP